MAEKSRKKKGQQSFRRAFWATMGVLPHWIKGPLLRGAIRIEGADPDGFVFKRAETFDEVSQAFALVYENYLQAGLTEANAAQLRLTKYHILPTTSLLIAKNGKEVVATFTLVVDSAMGLPIDQAWQIGHLRRKSMRLAEVTSLAIKKGYRRQKGRLLLPLFKFLYEYATKCLGVDRLVAVTHPLVADFYRHIILFDPISTKPGKYEQVLGAPAFSQTLDIGPSYGERLKKVYGHLPDEKNLYKLYLDPNPPTYHLPGANKPNTEHFYYSLEMLRYFFQNQVGVLYKLTDQERMILSNGYFHPDYHAMFLMDKQAQMLRQYARFMMRCRARIGRASTGEDGRPNQLLVATLLEASRAGLKLLVDSLDGFSVGQKLTIVPEIDGELSGRLRGTITYLGEANSTLGVKLEGELPREWEDMLNQLEEHIHLCRISKVAA